ncbi:2154_t:CDS:2 [Entrophospora sp. SA101]|nr:2154_t:CDS:2 [Entrophospora sp. SA101]
MCCGMKLTSHNIKADKEVKSLQSLTTSLEKEKNELLEKTKQLEARVEENMGLGSIWN